MEQGWGAFPLSSWERSASTQGSVFSPLRSSQPAALPSSFPSIYTLKRALAPQAPSLQGPRMNTQLEDCLHLS